MGLLHVYGAVFKCFNWGERCSFLGFTMPCMNALFHFLLEVHGVVCKCFNGVDRCNFRVYPFRAYMHYPPYFLQRFIVQFFSASMRESGTVFESFHAVHAFTLPPPFRCLWCSFQVLQWGRAMQFLGVTMPCLNALFYLLLKVHGAVCECFNGVDRCNFGVI